MNARQLAAQKRADALALLNRASKMLDRACNDRDAPNEHNGDGPLYWAYARGAAHMCIWQALAYLGDPALLNQWEAQMKAEREAREAAKAKAAEGATV